MWLIEILLNLSFFRREGIALLGLVFLATSVIFFAHSMVSDGFMLLIASTISFAVWFVLRIRSEKARL
jgi:hypothetical protein